MVKHKRRRRFTGSVWTIVILVALLTATTLLTGGSSSPVSRAWQTAFAPIQKCVAAVTHWFGGQFASPNAYTLLQDEVKVLRTQLADADVAIRNSAAIVAENERLRSLLKMAPRHNGLTLVMANITGFDGSNWVMRFKLDRGARDGIAPGMCVVDEAYGLAGIVCEVGESWAVVTGITDTASRVGARLDRTGAAGVAAGNYENMQANRLLLTMLPAGVDVNTGDLVVTSGMNAMHPPGLVIGTVDSVRKDGGGLDENAVITPAVTLYALRQVFVVIAYENEF